MKQAVLVAEGKDLWNRTGLQPALVLHFLCPALLIALFGSTALAASVFPGEYDIRYRWISALASARDNPDGYHYFGAGLICLGLLSATILRHLFLHCPGHYLARRVAATIYASGILGMLSLGIESTFFPNLGATRPLHQTLTLVAFGGCALGMSCFVFLVSLAGYGTRPAQCYATVAGLMLAVPFIASGLSNLVWHLTLGDPELFGSDTPKRLPWVVLSQPFWEWTMMVNLVAVLYLTIWYLQRERRPLPQEALNAARAGIDAR